VDKKQEPRETLLMAFVISLPAILWRSVTIFLMMGCWHPEDEKCTVLAGADGAAKAVGLLEMDSMFLAVDHARLVSNHCLFFLVRDARYRPESMTDFAVGTLILD